MSTEREELAAVLVEAYGDDPETCPCEQDFDVADAILAAGYRKQRNITTVAELDAMPNGTKLYSRETTHSWVLNDLGEHGGVKVHGTGGGYTYLEDFIKFEAPLVVLHTPEGDN